MLFGKIGGIYEWTTVAQTISGFNTTTTFNTSRNTTTTFSTSRSTIKTTTFNTNRSTTTFFLTQFDTIQPGTGLFTFLTNTLGGTQDERFYCWISDSTNAELEIWWTSVGSASGGTPVTILATSGSLASYTDIGGTTYFKGSAVYTAGANQYFRLNREKATNVVTNRNTTTTFSTSRSTSKVTTYNTSRTTTTILSTSRTTTTGNLKNTDRVTRYYQ